MHLGSHIKSFAIKIIVVIKIWSRGLPHHLPPSKNFELGHNLDNVNFLSIMPIYHERHAGGGVSKDK